ncbi:MAG: DNA repair protein RadA [uncultured Campylobacterales bacterium]|uniref:DNA repair protein RadA n=1 Tax=uncultured Campylobacterales bacterium TaxID=352960 RepID=A0A6S6SDQ1_9BACT|nr:MAG: DNA repair protein RadA [uncultured Campylobacterales bacterium]
MKKTKTLFECQSCGFSTPKWLGKCPDCDTWDSFVENTVSKTASKDKSSYNEATKITDIKIDAIHRFSTYNKELDIVLGGGIVPASLILIGGAPGIGKSTLLLKLASDIAKHNKLVLYVSAEESPAQIKLRANRLDANEENLYLLSELKLERILQELSKRNYELLIIDSIQTIYSEELNSAPGSVSQVKENTFELMRISKEKGISTFIVGHITKDGAIAGPRVLEHMVDTVLYFEGDNSKDFRILRGFKNRFGSTSEIGIFEMTSKGLISATDISNKFFSRSNNQAGSTLSITMEGSRPIVFEIQALVSDKSYPTPKRSSTGFDLNRLNMLIALLEKKLGFELGDYDIFLNISGGLKINETSIDLAVIAAIISSFKDRAINPNTIFLGEVSLTGDIREVFNLDVRLKEALMQGFEKIILPKKPTLSEKGLKYYEVSKVTQVLDWM